VDVTLQYFTGCPGWQTTEANLRQALGALGLTDVDVVHQLIETASDAQAANFVGSPTVLIYGDDPSATPGQQPALACRLYRTEHGPANAPSINQLVTALTAHLT